MKNFRNLKEIQEKKSHPQCRRPLQESCSFFPDNEGEEERDDDEATQFRKRIQKTFEAYELKKQDEALKKKKKGWYDKQQKSQKD